MDRMTGEAFGQDATTAARRKVDEFVSTVKDQASKLRTKSFDDLWGGTLDYVKDNPGKTILASLAVGVVLGSLLRRNRGE